MTDNVFDVSQKTIVLTGGLGLLGRHFARALLERGAKLAVIDALEAGREILAERLGEHASSEALIVITGDVTSRLSLERALDVVTRRWGGPPDVLINNAALDSPPGSSAEENGPFEMYPESSWRRVLDVNLTGVFLCCQVFGGAMARAGRGSIINISSIYGLVSPDQRIYEYRRREGQAFYKPVAYSASKSALFNLTRYLATYWAKAGVRVNTLTFAGVFNNQDEDFLKGYTERVPLGRMARADEYNGAVIFLASEASSYMTGANLVIDGGWTAW